MALKELRPFFQEEGDFSELLLSLRPSGSSSGEAVTRPLSGELIQADTGSLLGDTGKPNISTNLHLIPTTAHLPLGHGSALPTLCIGKWR